MILSICEIVEVLKVIRIIRILIKIIKIIVPILLIISASLTFMKAVSDGDNRRAIQSVKRKCIAALIIFLVPTFISLISNISSGEYLTALKCISNATTENINKIIIVDAEESVATVKKSYNRSDLYNAREAISRIDDNDTYNYYEKQLNEIEEEITKKESAKSQPINTNFVSTDAGWWWPVGSSTTTNENGKTFAKGSPSAIRITAYFGD